LTHRVGDVRLHARIVVDFSFREIVLLLVIRGVQVLVVILLEVLGLGLRIDDLRYELPFLPIIVLDRRTYHVPRGLMPGRFDGRALPPVRNEIIGRGSKEIRRFGRVSRLDELGVPVTVAFHVPARLDVPVIPLDGGPRSGRIVGRESPDDVIIGLEKRLRLALVEVVVEFFLLVLLVDVLPDLILVLVLVVFLEPAVILVILVLLRLLCVVLQETTLRFRRVRCTPSSPVVRPSRHLAAVHDFLAILQAMPSRPAIAGVHPLPPVSLEERASSRVSPPLAPLV